MIYLFILIKCTTFTIRVRLQGGKTKKKKIRGNLLIFLDFYFLFFGGPGSSYISTSNVFLEPNLLLVR